ncbi:MAG: polysaccharide biosynthesis C-terminal domain-containing protein [Patescibacteria group bacterium]
MYSYFKFAKHTFLIGALHASGVIQSLIFLPIITKILGAGDYGIWVQIKATIGLLIPFGFFGLQDSLLRFLSGEKNREKVQEGVYSSLIFTSGVTLIMALILIVFSGPTAAFFQFAPVFVKLLALIIVFESLNSAFLIVIQTRKEIERYFGFSILKTLGETGLIIGAITFGWGLYGAVFSLLLGRIAIFLILFIYIIKKIGIKIPDFSLIKDYLRFGMPTMTNNFSYWVVASADRYIIGLFLGILFVGYYAPAYSVGMLLVFFIIPITSILTIVLPKFFDDNNFDEVKKYLSYSLKYFLLIMTPAVFGVSILSRQLLEILSTKEIAANAYFTVPFIAAAMFVYGIACFFNQILFLAKKTKLIAAIWGVAAFINLGLNAIFIPMFGIMAAAIITFISYFCVFVLIWHFAFKELKFKIDWNFMVKSIAASILMILFIRWLDPWGMFNVVLSIIYGVFVYSILIFLFRGIGKKEFAFLRELIKSPIKNTQI